MSTTQLVALGRSRKPSKLGRPRKEEAGKRFEELLETAADLFLEHGYQQVTMELIANAIGMTKRTIYARHADKAALFVATVQHAMDRLTVDQAEVLEDLKDAELEAALFAVGRMRLKQVTSQVGVRLQRTVNAEAIRFPEIAAMANEQVTKPVIAYISGLLENEAARGNIEVDEPDLTASLFLSMVAGAPARSLAFGRALQQSEIDKRISVAVRLFIRGIRPSGVQNEMGPVSLP